MNQRHTTPRYSLWLAALASAASGLAVAQDGQRGNASVWPAGMLFRDASLEGVRLKPLRDAATPPAAWAPHSANGTEAHYDVTNFSGGGLSPITSSIQFDAISSGNGIIPTPIQNGAPNVPGGWIAFAMSIKDGGTGLPGSHFDTAHTSTGHAGSEVVSFYLSSSTGITSALVGQPVLETSRAHIGLPPAGSEDLDGLDYGIGLRTFNPNLTEMAFFRHGTSVFFSVTKEWAETHSAEPFAWDATNTAQPPNATDVYVARWDATTSTWLGPFVYATGDLLGFDRQSGDLDALEVDRVRRVLVYSGRNFDNGDLTYGGSILGDPSQLMIVQLAENPNIPVMPPGGDSEDFSIALAGQLPQALRDLSTDEVTLAEKAGVGDDPTGDPDDIDAVCDFDPDGGLLGAEVGTPVTSDVAMGYPLGLSVARELEPAGGPSTWAVQLTGWGLLQPQPVRLGLYAYPDRVTAGAVPPLSSWGLVSTAVRSPFDGPVTFDISGLSYPVGREMSLRVVVYPQTSNQPLGSTWIQALKY